MADRRHLRLAGELGILAAIGLVMFVLAPFGGEAMPPHIRFLYWQFCIVGGGLIGLAVDAALAARIALPLRRVPPASLLMTPLVTLLVLGVNAVLFPFPTHFHWQLVWQVFVVSIAVMTVRALAWRRPATIVETRTLVAPPLPEAEAAFRRRLSAKRRTARLIAIEAEDHYLRVHTDQGDELITMRFADALDELALAHGYRVHRGWWVSAAAIEGVRWRKGAGDVQLVGGITAPVSRSYMAALKEAGWR